MECLVCHNKIHSLRKLVDRKFCSDAHRRKYPGISARAARELEWTGDPWTETKLGRDDRHPSIAPAHAEASAVLLGFFAVLFMVLAFVGAPASSSSTWISPATQSLGFSETLKSAIRSRAAVRFRDDFKAGLGNWMQFGRPHDWTYAGGFVQPHSLRLWKRSMTMADYTFEFQAQIEQKGLGWVYRAKDARNFYATKILITGPDPLPRAHIVRYTMLNGKESARVRLPLPAQIRIDMPWKVVVKAKGDHFSTLVNGQMVDSWTDRRLKTGGVGFFAERGEIATVRYASIAEGNTFMGRLFSYAQAGYTLLDAAYSGF